MKGENITNLGSSTITPEQRAQECSKEITDILEKYECVITLRETSFYGQRVFEPIISPKK